MFPPKPAVALQSPRDVTVCDVTPPTAYDAVSVGGALEPCRVRYCRVRTVDYCRHQTTNTIHVQCEPITTIINIINIIIIIIIIILFVHKQYT